MITVRCPACDAAYQLDEAKLANGGRKLKCARCQTVWLATAELAPAEEPIAAPDVADVPAPEADASLAVPATDGEADVTAEAEGEVEEDAPAEGDVEGDGGELLVRRDYAVEDVVKIGGWRQYLRGGNLWRSVAVGIVVLGLLTGAAVLGVRIWPMVFKPKADVAEVTAIPGDTWERVTPPAGVVLHSVRGTVAPVEGGNGEVALTVRGLLANTSSATLVVPPLHLELLGADGAVADRWPVGGVGGEAEAGAEQAWSVSLSAPDMRAVKGWRVVFVRQRAPEQTSEKMPEGH